MSNLLAITLKGDVIQVLTKEQWAQSDLLTQLHDPKTRIANALNECPELNANEWAPQLDLLFLQSTLPSDLFDKAQWIPWLQSVYPGHNLPKWILHVQDNIQTWLSIPQPVKFLDKETMNLLLHYMNLYSPVLKTSTMFDHLVTKLQRVRQSEAGSGVSTKLQRLLQSTAPNEPDLAAFGSWADHLALDQLTKLAEMGCRLKMESLVTLIACALGNLLERETLHTVKDQCPIARQFMSGVCATWDNVEQKH